MFDIFLFFYCKYVLLQNSLLKLLKFSRRKEITKIRVERVKERPENYEKINKIKSCFFFLLNKIDKPLERLRDKGKTQIK